MAINIPGLSLSILRQQTSVRAGLPLLISGRFTAFGMGVPTLIRVFLEGPSYDPQIRSFDTFASPFSGDYTTNVIAEKDGHYNVYAQAFPPPLIPTGPPFPEAIMLLPPIAESTKPPLVVGAPFNGGVEALLPDGTRERLPAPEMLDIEITPIVTIGAPAITIAPGVPRFIPFAPPPPPPAAPAPPPPVEEAPPPVEEAPPPPPVEEAPPPPVEEAPLLTLDILSNPSLNLPRQLNVGDIWFGSVTLPTFAVLPLFAETQLLLLDSQGNEYIVSRPRGKMIQPGETMQILVNYDTSGLAGGNYTILLQVFDEVGQLVAEFPMGFLMIEAITPPPAVPVRYILEVTNSPFGAGGIRITPEAKAIFQEGETVTLEAVPDNGFIFKEWLLDGVLWAVVNPVNITMSPTALVPGVPHILTAVYIEAEVPPPPPPPEVPALPIEPVQYILQVTNSPFGAGGIRITPEAKATFQEGETVTLEAIPRNGNQFKEWLLDGVPWAVVNPVTITMSPTALVPEVPHTATAVYLLKQG